MPQDTQCTYQPFEDSMAAATQMKTAVVNNGIQVYYREAYPAFTTATILAQRYRVLAPDLPGFTVVPADRKYEYTLRVLHEHYCYCGMRRHFEYQEVISLRLRLWCAYRIQVRTLNFLLYKI